MRQDLSKKILLLFLLGVTFFSTPSFLNARDEIEEKIEELERRNVPLENVMESLAEKIQYLGGKINLSAEEQAKIKSLSKKLKNLAAQAPDAYTQSEAHLSLPYIRSLLAKNFPNAENYLNIISSVFVKEAIFKKTHYVFYHAQDNKWRIPRDLYYKLYERLRPISATIKDFEFIRWQIPERQMTAKEFILDELRQSGFIDDDLPDIKAVLVSVNLALFGNVGNTKRCTWEYFMEPTSIEKPSPGSFKSVLDMFGASYNHIDRLINLDSLLRTKEQTLLQIFIPKELVDDIAYLAFGRGMPAHQQTMDWIVNNVARKRKYQKRYPYMKSLEELHNKFKKEKDKNPLYRELIERAEKGDFSLSSLLEIYCNTPWKIDDINNLQARLTFTNSILTDPSLPIKFFHYDTIPEDIEKKYNTELDKIADLIVQERLMKAKTEGK